MRVSPLLLLASLAALAAPAGAQLNKCTGPDGKVTYQSDACPSTSKAGTVRPPATSAPSSAAEVPKDDGWDAVRVERMHGGCLEGGLRDARAAWEIEARQNSRFGDFPEGPMRAALVTYCTCLVDTTRANVKADEALDKAPDFMARLARESMQGGRCRPTGVLARVMGF